MDRASAFVVDRVKTFPTSSFIAVENLVVVSCTVCAHVGGPNNLGDAWVPPLGMGAWLVSLGCVLGIARVSQKFGRRRGPAAWNGGVADL